MYVRFTAVGSAHICIARRRGSSPTASQPLVQPDNDIFASFPHGLLELLFDLFRAPQVRLEQ
jgi:hypothetical protein